MSGKILVLEILGKKGSKRGQNGVFRLYLEKSLFVLSFSFFLSFKFSFQFFLEFVFSGSSEVEQAVYSVTILNLRLSYVLKMLVSSVSMLRSQDWLISFLRFFALNWVLMKLKA